MTTSTPVFLDANAIVYALDQSSNQHDEAVALIQELLNDEVTLCTSHHVIEEVLHIVHKLSDSLASDVVKEIDKLPGLTLIEPDAVIAFAERYAELSDRLHMGINDALLLQLMLDAGITRLFTYDKKFINRAAELGITSIF